MPESFPSTPRAPAAVRVGALVIALLGVALAVRTTATSARWIGRTFPGFLILDNRVVASVGLGQWSGAGAAGLYQSTLRAVDERSIHSTPQAYAVIAERPPGTPVEYRVEQAGVERRFTIRTQRFTLRDWCLLFGVFLFNGTVFLASGLVAWVLRPDSPMARALFAAGTSTAVFLFTAMDLYGPATFFRLHALAETLMPGAFLHLALVFPHRHAYAHMRFAGYALSLALAVPYQLFLYQPAEYPRILRTSMLYVGLVAVFFCLRLVAVYWRGASPLARQRVQVIMLGTLAGFALPAAVLTLAALVADGVAMNLAALTPFMFAVALAYAVVKHDLFEIDAMVKRGVYYLALTTAIGAVYVAAVLAFNFVLRLGATTDSVAFPLVFTLAVLLLFNPLRSRLQAFVDRVFFGTHYESATVLARVGAELSGALTRDQIARLVRECVEATVPNEATRLFVRSDDGLREVGGAATVPAIVAERLAGGGLLTAFHADESGANARGQGGVRAGLDALGAVLAVPLTVRDDLIGVLTVGPKRSRLFYTAADAEFLRALGSQTAIALENAASYEALAEVNARLEERVRERTTQLESANRELTAAYGDLKQAQAQLVHSEKMASLGRLVAGVAHEINNPVSAIATNVAPLRRRLERAAACVPNGDAGSLLREAQEIVALMARGAERTAAIVKDLRTFSRLGESVRKPVDLHEGLEVSLRLLESRWRGRIEVHRDYGPLPLVECDPGQINQVFMNLIANACDAIRGRGNLWMTTRAADARVSIVIRDDGEGVPPDVIGRVFDPFFTTKDVGAGTGLGLAICHGIVAAHGGRLTVESAPGTGATFRVELPVEAARLDSSAGRAR
jgi:signal transduction histidine kinase